MGKKTYSVLVAMKIICFQVDCFFNFSLFFFQATGLSGSTSAGHSSDQIETMEPVKDRIIKVTFNSDVHSSLQWNFKPQQTEVYVSN